MAAGLAPRGEEHADREPATQSRADKDQGRSSRSGAVVPAHGGNGCQRALDRDPTVAWTRPAVGEYRLRVVNSRVNGPVGAAFQDHGRLSRAGAIDIEHPTADIHGTADLRKMLPVPRTLCLLVKKPGDHGDCKDACPNGRGGKCCRSQFRRHSVFPLLDTDLLLRVPLLRGSTGQWAPARGRWCCASGPFRPAKARGRVTRISRIGRSEAGWERYVGIRRMHRPSPRPLANGRKRGFTSPSAQTRLRTPVGKGGAPTIGESG
jgi:hypothetical protein